MILAMALSSFSCDPPPSTLLHLLAGDYKQESNSVTEFELMVVIVRLWVKHSRRKIFVIG